MPRGYPDWFGQPQFPKYGGTYRQAQLVSLLHNGETKTIYEINAKGRVFGGVTFLSTGGDISNIQMRLYIDDQYTDEMTPSRGIWYNYTIPGIKPLILTYYDTLYDQVTISIGTELPFENNFKVVVYNNAGNDLLVDGELFYNKVE
jgi:hypothetical protein